MSTLSSPIADETSASQLAGVAEPGPNWTKAIQVWGVAWELHWAGFGGLFSILAVLSLLALVQVRKKKGFGPTPLFVAINCLLVTLGATRAVYLFLDPYESGENGFKSPHWLAKLIYGIALPCLTSSFCLIHLAFLEVSKIQIGFKKLYSVRVLAGVITAHFVVVITAEVITAVNANFTPFLIVCQAFVVLWGFFLSISFIYSGLKVILLAERVQQQLEQIEIGKAVRVTGTRRKSKTVKVAKITIATSVLGLVCCGLQLYSLFGVYSLYSKVEHPSPWPWWALQTCYRLVEFCMACTIAYTVVQRSEPANSTDSSSNT
ncbi:proline-rich transmembrane protein 4-like [Oculina patagonica]